MVCVRAGPTLPLALLVIRWNATNATASVSRDAVADLTAVADFARPSKAWLTLTQVFTAERTAHYTDDIDR